MIQLITAAHELTSSWTDLGSAVHMNQGGVNARIAIWIQLDINASTNARIRALALKGASDTLEYTLPIKTVGTSDVKVEAEYFEFNTDADQNMILEVVTNGLVPYIQFQVQDSNNSTGQIDSAYYTLSKLT